jgi:hypothetical protein
MKTDKEPLTIFQFGDIEYWVYNEAGQCVERDFTTSEDAEQWIKDNGYRLVTSFFKTIHLT